MPICVECGASIEDKGVLAKYCKVCYKARVIRQVREKKETPEGRKHYQETQARYYDSHIDEIMVKRQKHYKELKQANDGRYEKIVEYQNQLVKMRTNANIKTLLDRFGTKCLVCHEEIEEPYNGQKTFMGCLVPKSKGGDVLDINNRCLLHAHCNAVKHSTILKRL